MARTTVITLVDDVDGTPATETVSFSVDGVAYEIDLSEANARKLRDEIAPWLNAGRRTGGRRIRGTGMR